jgi:CubicO group peptidase (beta-lactamase class C family)
VRDPKPGEAAFTLVPAEREMTVLDLLRHTSGLTYDRFSKNGPVREAYARAGLGIGPGTDLRTRTPVEFVERLSQAPLAIQPGSEWEYGLSTDLLGLVIEAVEGARLSEVLGRRIFVPLGMADSGFQVTPANSGRLARPLPSERGSGTTSGYVDVSVPPRLDSGGQGGVSTASDYFRFCQMILDGGRLDGTRILSRASVALMGTDQLGTAIRAPPVMAMGSPGYTWGLGFAVRRPSGPVAVLGSPGEIYWGGAPSGGGFWIDPREQTVVVFLTSASWSDYGTYRAVVKQMVNAALTD